MVTRGNGTASRRGLRWAVALATAVLLVDSAVAAQPAAAVPAGGMSADQLNSTFTAYGNAGGHWTGGDSTASVPLPDGRVAWLFSDSYLGTVNPDGSRPPDSRMVNNTMVVQDGTSLVSTRHGGTAAAPEALVKPSQAGEFFWVADGTVEGSSLKVIYNRYRRSGTGNLDFTLTGTSLATFSLPALTLSSVRDLPLGDTVVWGSAVLENGGYTYVYGSESTTSALKFAKLARVPTGGLDGAWQFWTGSAWSATESSAARLLSGVGTAYAVQKVGAQYVLLTHENNLVFDPQYVAYTAASPAGPFTGPQQLFSAPEARPGTPIITYDAHLHPALARPGKLLVSYNVNSLDDGANLADASIYRPRFVEVDWPRPTPDPATLPAAPAGVAVSVDSAGRATLTWQPVAGATGYRVHQRNVTAGQTHFARLPATVTGTSQLLDLLRSDNTYEFKVTAVNAAGEGAFSATVNATPRISAPPAPTGLAATPNQRGAITLTWGAVPGAWNYEVYRRDVTAEEPEAAFVTRVGGTQTSHLMEWLEPDHAYEFHVVASHGGGLSPASATVSATAFYGVPGAPTGLTATAQADGQIRLSWTAPEPHVLFWVYQRDVTAGETEFTRLRLPIEGTAMTAGFLTHAHEYEYRVAAANRGGEGAQSTPARATSSYPVPGTPSGLTATARDGEVQLTWSGSATEGAWYHVYQRDVTAGETEFTQLPLPIAECCTMTAGYLANGHEYEFRVTATMQGRESAASGTVRATPQMPKPGQVTGLSATAQADGAIRLSWTAPGENLWFDVYQRDVTAGTGFEKLSLPVTSCCSFSARLLTHNHAYEFKVAATNAAGAGPQSATAGATARYSPPAAPGDLRGVAAGNATINLDWDAPGAGSFFYWVYYRDVTAGETAFTKGQFPTDRTEASLGLLKNDHVYEYKVTASNQGGEGPASAAVRVTAKGGVPAAPGGLTAAAGDGQVRLSWTAGAGSGISYQVYQRDVTTGQSWQKLPLPVTATTMTPGYLTNGHQYEFKVTALNFAGASGASNVVSARPMPPLPSAPSGLSASAGNGQVSLSWTGSSTPNVYYWVEMRPAGGTWDRLPYPVSTCCAFTVKLLTNGKQYEFRVRANNLAGDSGATNVAGARPMPPFPQPASGLSATAGNGKVTLRWSASPTADVSYFIEMRSKGGTWQRLPYPVGCCSNVVSLLLNGTTYEFRVRSTNLSGTAAATNTVSARPMPPVPAAPTGLTGRAWLGDSNDLWSYIQLNWTASSTKDAWYNVYFRKAGASTWQELPRQSRPDMPAETLTYYWGGTWEFRVSAYNIAGETYSSAIQVAARKPKREVYQDFTKNGPTAFGNFLNAKGYPSPWVDYRFDWSDNGCSSPSITNGFKYGDLFFQTACQRHDFGYRNHGSWGERSIIDSVFHHDMVRLCLQSADDYQACDRDAWLYYQGVRLGGGSHW